MFNSVLWCDEVHASLSWLMKVNYRESISRQAALRNVNKKQSGGSGQFADIAMRYEPGEPGSGFIFKSEIKGGTVPTEYIPGVVKASTQAQISHLVWTCSWVCKSFLISAEPVASPAEQLTSAKMVHRAFGLMCLLQVASCMQVSFCMYYRA